MSLRFDKVQTSLAKYATNRLSEDLNTTISIDKVEINPLNSIDLKGFFILDLENDTVINTKSISILLKNIDLENNNIVVNSITLNEADVQLIKRKNKKGFSFQFILDHFNKDQDSEKSENNFLITTNTIELKNSRFRFKDFRAKSTYYGMDFTDLDAANINLTFSDFKTLGTNTKVKIKHLSSVEKSNFNLKNLTGEVELDSNYVRIDSLYIETPKSSIITDYFRFDFENANDFEDDFEEKVKMTTYFRNASLNFSDLSYFSSFFNGINKTIKISGKFEGTVADFKTKNLLLKLDENTEFKGNVAMKGLPYTNNTIFDIKINHFLTTESDLNNLEIPPFTSNKKLTLPKELNGIGKIKLKGNLIGKFDDVKGKLIAETKQGNMETNGRLWKQGNTTFLKGKVIAQNLQVGKFINEPDLGSVDANLISAFSYNSKTGFDLKTKGELPSLSYKGYEYENIKLDGSFTDKSFEGFASIKDKNGSIDFKGAVNFDSDIPEYDFESTIKDLNIAKLKIIEDTNSHIISGKINLKGKGSTIDNSVGTSTLSSLVYIKNETKYETSTVTISSSINDKTRTLSIKSDVANIGIDGDFLLTELPKTFDVIGQKIVPALYSSLDTFVLENQNYNFNVEVKDYWLVQELFTPTLYISKNTTSTGKFISENEIFEFNCTADSIIYLSNKLENIKGKLKKPSDILKLNIDIAKASFGSDFSLEQLEISSLIKNDHIMPSIKWQSANGESYGKIQGDGYWYSEDYFDLIILPSYFHFKDRDWRISENATLIVDSTELNFNGMEITNNFGEAVSVVGIISEDPEEILKIYLDNFNIENLNPLIGNSDTRYYGKINGSACVQDIYNQMQIVSDFFIDKLEVNNELVGDIAFNTDWISEKKGVYVKGELLRDNLNTFDFIGFYYPFKESNSLDFKCELKNTNLAFLNPYVVEQGISEINGAAKGNVKVTGEPTTPLLEGEISLNRTGFNVDYLNTYYDFSGLIIIKNNDIYTDNIIYIHDVENNLAYFDGAIFHENFTDFDYGINIVIPDTVYRQNGELVPHNPRGNLPPVSNKFIGLNTTSELNDDFYGKVYATGDINIAGYQDEIDIEVNATTKKGSDFILPLYGNSTVELEDYIIFVDSHSNLNQTQDELSLEGINLDLNIEVTPDIELKMIFDEIYGDIISGTGYGNISMTVDKDDQFNMTGKYTIDKGDYLFTLGLERFENLINKRFEIANGSTINWYGDPYNAEIDINAIYKLKASMYEIMPPLTSDLDKYKKRSDIECEMKLTGGLMAPDINFGIEVVRADETERAVIANLMQTEQELTKQVFSLLLLNRFLPPANSITEQDRGGTGAVGTTASELLSNQLSNWLSKLSNDIDIGLNYRPGDDITSDEIAVALSTELLNDRLVISSNFGVTQGNEVNQNQNTLIGDVNVEYKINEDGSLRVRVFTRTNEYDITNINQSQSTSGVGMYYKKEFNTWKEFITSKKKQRRKR